MNGFSEEQSKALEQFAKIISEGKAEIDDRIAQELKQIRVYLYCFLYATLDAEQV